MTHEPPMPDDVVERLNAACVGHPHARIAWPHRLLHEATTEITQLRAPLAETERQVLAMREASSWLRDAAGQHVSGTEVNRWLIGAAEFMETRSIELAAIRALPLPPKA